MIPVFQRSGLDKDTRYLIITLILITCLFCSFLFSAPGSSKEQETVDIKSGVTDTKLINEIHEGMNKAAELFKKKAPLLKDIELMIGVTESLHVREEEINEKWLSINKELKSEDRFFNKNEALAFHSRIISLKEKSEDFSKVLGKVKKEVVDGIALPESAKENDEIIKRLEKSSDDLRQMIREYSLIAEINDGNDEKYSIEEFLNDLSCYDNYIEAHRIEKDESGWNYRKQYRTLRDQLADSRVGLLKMSTRHDQREKELKDLFGLFLENNGRYITRDFINNRFSVVTMTMLGNNKGLKALLIGGLFSKGEWTNDAVRLFAKAGTGNERFTIIQVHQLPRLKAGSNAFNLLDNFEVGNYQNETEIIQLIDYLENEIHNNDLVFVLGNEPEGGSTLYFDNKAKEDERISKSFEQIRDDDDFKETLDQHCGDLSQLITENKQSMLSVLSRTSPQYPVYDLRICGVLDSKTKINQVRIVLNHLLTEYGIIKLTIENLPDTYSLINIKDLSQDILIDMKYSTGDNFLNQKMYQVNECYLQKSVAMKLVLVQEYLEKRGLGIKCLDCYRPLVVQQEMWKIKPDARYVANPEKGSHHNRGIAVDVTLVDAQGRELEMPTEFDDFTKKAWRDYNELVAWEKDNRDLLKKAMEKYGFRGIRTEWWHYSGAPAKEHPLLFTPLVDID